MLNLLFIVLALIGSHSINCTNITIGQNTNNDNNQFTFNQVRKYNGDEYKRNITQHRKAETQMKSKHNLFSDRRDDSLQRVHNKPKVHLINRLINSYLMLNKTANKVNNTKTLKQFLRKFNMKNIPHASFFPEYRIVNSKYGLNKNFFPALIRIYKKLKRSERRKSVALKRIDSSFSKSTPLKDIKENIRRKNNNRLSGIEKSISVASPAVFTGIKLINKGTMHPRRVNLTSVKNVRTNYKPHSFRANNVTNIFYNRIHNNHTYNQKVHMINNSTKYDNNTLYKVEHRRTLYNGVGNGGLTSDDRDAYEEDTYKGLMEEKPYKSYSNFNRMKEKSEHPNEVMTQENEEQYDDGKEILLGKAGKEVLLGKLEIDNRDTKIPPMLTTPILKYPTFHANMLAQHSDVAKAHILLSSKLAQFKNYLNRKATLDKHLLLPHAKLLSKKRVNGPWIVYNGHSYKLVKKPLSLMSELRKTDGLYIANGGESNYDIGHAKAYAINSKFLKTNEPVIYNKKHETTETAGNGRSEVGINTIQSTEVDREEINGIQRYTSLIDNASGDLDNPLTTSKGRLEMAVLLKDIDNKLHPHINEILYKLLRPIDSSDSPEHDLPVIYKTTDQNTTEYLQDNMNPSGITTYGKESDADVIEQNKNKYTLHNNTEINYTADILHNSIGRNVASNEINEENISNRYLDKLEQLPTGSDNITVKNQVDNSNENASATLNNTKNILDNTDIRQINDTVSSKVNGDNSTEVCSNISENILGKVLLDVKEILNFDHKKNENKEDDEIEKYVNKMFEKENITETLPDTNNEIDAIKPETLTNQSSHNDNNIDNDNKKNKLKLLEGGLMDNVSHINSKAAQERLSENLRLPRISEDNTNVSNPSGHNNSDTDRVNISIPSRVINAKNTPIISVNHSYTYDEDECVGNNTENHNITTGSCLRINKRKPLENRGNVKNIEHNENITDEDEASDSKEHSFSAIGHSLAENKDVDLLYPAYKVRPSDINISDQANKRRRQWSAVNQHFGNIVD